MARLGFTTRKRRLMRMFLYEAMTTIVWFFLMVCTLVAKHRRDKPRIRYSLSNRDRYSILHMYAYESDAMCISQLRMNRKCFKKLCDMLERLGGLRANRNMDIDEQVAIFLHMIAHNVKNRVVRCRFHRSGDTISRLFTRVCNAVNRLHSRLLKKPEPVREDSTDGRWKWFKNCLGALDGTYIKCLVPLEDKPRYRTRKNDIATNVLGVCSQDMQFIYVLSGWEGSAADSRVLRDALLRPRGLKVPRPYYYLVDGGYTNGEGFLAPYRGQRYHLNEWRDGYQPTTPKEFFNMKHSSARNVIERCFGILKARWGILKDNLYYPIELKNKVILACCLLLNFIRQEMPSDPFEDEYGSNETEDDGHQSEDHINSVGSSTEWTAFRNNLAQSMGDKSQGRKYRNWSKIEDAKLVEALVNMVNVGGFKADNSFKSGYLQHLEQALKASPPESNLLGKPHIESRIKTMKKDWQAVHDMVSGMNTSGFGYDSSTKCVTAEAQVWEPYLQTHKEAAKWKNKTFPYYEDLCFVFGKDRATGDKAVDYEALDENAHIDEEEQSNENMESPAQVSHIRSEECTSRGSRKRKSRSDALLDSINNAALLLGENLKEASNNMVQSEVDLQKKIAMVRSELAKMQSLSRMDRFKAFKKITHEPEYVLTFWNLEEEAREEFVKDILEY